MSNLSWALLISSIILFVTFLMTFSPSQKVRVGDIYGTTNPGPDDVDDPFVALYQVIEIHNDQAKCNYRSLHMDARTLETDLWVSTYDLSQYKTLLKRGEK